MESQPGIINNFFAFNEGHSGAAIGLNLSPASVKKNIMIYNSSLVNGGGIMVADYSDGIFEDNLILENSAGFYGGGINIMSSSPRLHRNVIASNSSILGGGLYLLSYACPELMNNTITGNTADSLGNGIYAWGFCDPKIVNSVVWGDSGTELVFEQQCDPLIIYSDIQGGCPGTGNIDADPGFVLPVFNDFRILYKSPCIDKGIPKVFDSDGTVSDIGAYFFDQSDYLTLYTTPHQILFEKNFDVSVTYTVINRYEEMQNFWLKSLVKLPDQHMISVVDPVFLKIAGNTTGTKTINQHVHEFAASGKYEYISVAGMPPGSLYDRDNFPFFID